jgi:hypothetical protein
VQPFEIWQDFLPTHAIEGGKRLVHQEQTWLRKKGSTDGNTLTLSTGEIRRRPIKEQLDAKQVDYVIETDRPFTTFGTLLSEF